MNNSLREITRAGFKCSFTLDHRVKPGCKVILDVTHYVCLSVRYPVILHRIEAIIF